jgi:hypothetical protein
MRKAARALAAARLETRSPLVRTQTIQKLSPTKLSLGGA